MTDVKVTGPFLRLKHAVPNLREGDRGTVVNISLVGGKRPYPNRTPYAAANMAMMGMRRTWAHELGDDDITVDTICPGRVEGPRIERVIGAQAEKRGLSPETIREEEFFSELALAEVINPGRIAGQIAHLASDAGGQITAQDLNVDAGMTWY